MPLDEVPPSGVFPSAGFLIPFGELEVEGNLDHGSNTLEEFALEFDTMGLKTA
ncbi:MAG: hypothetical protein ACREUT_20830 [Steroidobacteraceae bacterium]